MSESRYLSHCVQISCHVPKKKGLLHMHLAALEGRCAWLCYAIETYMTLLLGGKGGNRYMAAIWQLGVRVTQHSPQAIQCAQWCS